MNPYLIAADPSFHQPPAQPGPSGMVQCPRKAGSGMAWAKCLRLRDATKCQGCPHLAEDFAHLDALIEPMNRAVGPIPEFPFTRDCKRAGHRAYAGCLRCRTCALHARAGQK